MKSAFKQNAFLRFIFLAACIYFILFLVYQFIVKRYTYYDQKFIGSIILSVNYFLKLIGYTTFMQLQDQDYQVIGIDGSNGVWVGSKCNAITLFSLFSVFILAYPGAQKNKIWFIPVGIIMIHFLNLLRVTALVVISKFAPNYLDFNHTYTFTFLIYMFIFSLWMIWVNKFSNHSLAQVKNEN